MENWTGSAASHSPLSSLAPQLRSSGVRLFSLACTFGSVCRLHSLQETALPDGSTITTDRTLYISALALNRASGDQTRTQGPHGGLSSIVDTKLGQNTADVRFHRAHRDIALVRNLAVTVPVHDEGENFKFPLR